MQDIPDLLEGLRRAPRLLRAFVSTIPESRLDVRRREGFWTIAEHVNHLARVQPMLLDRLQRFLNEDHPEFVPYLPGKNEAGPSDRPRMDTADALDQFEHIRGKQLRLLRSAGDAVWKKTATHPEYEHYSFYILVRHILMHDCFHMYRMEELWLTKEAYLTGQE